MLKIESKEFLEYGYVIEGNYEDIVSFLLTNSPMPTNDINLYERDDERMALVPSIKSLQELVFGGSEIETGYCNGYNNKLNCLEYHASPEINVAATDLVLLLASRKDIKNGFINSKDVKAFYVKKGTCLVLNPYTLHFSPCRADENGFKCAVILPQGTNKDLTFKPKDRMLWKENKWLLAHSESKQASLGAYIGIKGDNIEIKL